MDTVHHLDQHTALEQYSSKLFCALSKIIKQEISPLCLRKTVCGKSFPSGMHV